MSFICPRCHKMSHHPADEIEGYCGACHDWTGDKLLRLWEVHCSGCGLGVLTANPDTPVTCDGHN